ncbi:hypothetical protein PCE1_002864 [Barthelona sp. PCE]
MEEQDDLFHLGNDYASGTTRWLEQRRELLKVEEELQHKREQYKRLSEKFDEQENEIQQKNLQLQDQLSNFDKFLQDNYQKKVRAELKASQEARQRRQKEREIELLKEKISVLDEERFVIEQQVNSSQFYVSYLEDICDISDDFVESADIQARFFVLLNANEELLESITDFEQAISKYKNMNMNLENEMKSVNILKNHQISILRQELEKLRGIGLQVSLENEEKILKILSKATEIGNVLFGCENIFDITLSNQNVAKKRVGGAATKSFKKQANEVNSQDHLKKLVVIADVLKHFQSILCIVDEEAQS